MSSEAASLLRTLAGEFGQGYGLGSMSCSVYDTAWVSCVSKPSGTGPRQWLFPFSFQFILDSQHADGGWHWPPQDAHDCADGTILSSLAALFAITQHIKHPFQLVRLQDKAGDHLKRGIEFVARALRRFRRTSNYSVGFEVLVPALLTLLEKEGVTFHFSGRKKLFQRRDAKLSRVPLGRLDRMPSTMLHSLEALYGDMNFSFDSLRSRLVYGSIMASPSATAAYLMRCSEWDDSAEAYLRLTLSNGAGQGSGGVPSAFPSTNFELIWVTSTLLKAGCVGSDLAGAGAQILDIFEGQIPKNGLIGFAPGIQPDLDDSANASIVFSLLGKPGLSQQMREQFETKTHFETYKSESNESISANCSIVLALLLDLNHDSGAVSAVEKGSKYLVTKWFNADGPIEDKWNISEYYSTMLFAQAMMKLILCWEACELPSLSEELLHQIVLTAFRSLLRILRMQSSDGSWGSKGPCEETAYAILALVELAGLPMASFFNQQIHSALLHGRNFLKARNQAGKPEYLWVEKVLYSAQNLSQAYIFAALNVRESPPMDCRRTRSFLNIDYSGMPKFVDIFQRVPLLAPQPRWLILASWIEGQLFLSMLQEVRRAAFSRAGMTKDKYLTWIPVIWTLANNTNRSSITAKLLFDMMCVSVLNFQTDEFMETVLDPGHGEEISTVRDIIEDLFKSINLPSGTELPSGGTKNSTTLGTTTNGVHNTEEVQVADAVYTSTRDGHLASDAAPVLQPSRNSHDSGLSSSHSSISQSLRHFISYINGLTTTACVPPSSNPRIYAELKAFLHAHLTQTQLNMNFSAQKRAVETPSNAPIVYQNPAAPSFRTWLHATAAVHTSCPYSFVLYLALASAAHGAPLLRTPRQCYIAEDLCGHLARMCRLYNDYGSMKRDLAEGNLNSVNFPDFQKADDDDGVEAADPSVADTAEGNEVGFDGLAEEERLKRRLMALAEWERKGLDRAVEELEKCTQTDERLMGALKVFVDVTDLFGQVYVVKDLASRKT